MYNEKMDKYLGLRSDRREVIERYDIPPARFTIPKIPEPVLKIAGSFFGVAAVVFLIGFGIYSMAYVHLNALAVFVALVFLYSRHPLVAVILALFFLDYIFGTNVTLRLFGSLAA